MNFDTKATIGLSSLILLGMITNTFVFDDNQLYYCEARMSVGLYHCDNLSQYYSIPNGKCINYEQGNKLCRSGWLLAIEDRVNEEDIPPDEFKGETNKIICDTNECINLYEDAK